MGLEDFPEEFSPAELQAYISTLPQPFLTRLQLNDNGVAGDYVNTFAAPLFDCNLVAMRPLGEREEYLQKRFAAMGSYFDYLVARVREYNSHMSRDGELDEIMVVGSFMAAPNVPLIDEKVLDVKNTLGNTNMDPDEKLETLKQLLNEGIALVRVG